MAHSGKLRQIGLGAQLRGLREKAGLTTRSVAQALDISASSVNRTELGTRVPDRQEVGALCALYGVTGEDKVRLFDRAEKGSHTTAWLEMPSKAPEQAAALVVLEQEADVVSNVELALIPGLVQTSDYFRLLLRTSHIPDDEIEQRVVTRLGRQAILSRPNAPGLRLVIDEGILYRTLGNRQVMREQLEYLLLAQLRTNVSLRVIPFDATTHGAIEGGFSMYEVPAGRPYILVESRNVGVFLTESVDVAPFLEAWRKLQDHALDEDESTKLIKAAARRLEDA